MLELRDVTASYPGAGDVLRGINLRVEPGGTECVIGPSGCGKTTLLLVAAGLKPPAGGQVLLDGSPVRGGDLRLSLVQQQYGLLPWFSAEENVGLGLRVRGVGKGQRAALVGALLERGGLRLRAESYPRELSGGEQQRVALLRALATRPSLLLLDEPFSALDAITRESLQGLLGDLLAECRVAALLVTHSIEEAVFLGSSISLLAGAPATIVERFENAGRGSREFRGTSGFLELENRIRNAMKRYKVLPDE